MLDRVQQVLDGSIGYFWPQHQMTTFQDLSEHDKLRGYIHLNNDLIQVDVLDEDGEESLFDGRHERQVPLALLGMTEKTPVMVVGIINRGWQTNFGGFRASVQRYRAECLLTGVPLHAVKNGMILRASAFFDGLLPWAGLTGMTETVLVGDDQRPQDVVINLQNDEQKLSAGSVGDIAVAVAPHWVLEGAEDARTIRTSLRVDCESDEPAPLSRFTEVLTQAQDLLGLAMGRFVPAAKAQAVVDCEVQRERERSVHLWYRRLMVEPAHTPPGLSTGPKRAYFTLDDLGGPKGLGRWLQLSRSHRRAVSPLTGPTRWGSGAVETKLQELCAAIEYYENKRRREERAAGGTLTPKMSQTHAHALARRAQPAFHEWIGDVDRWADEVWKSYNGLKHDPTFDRDPIELQWLSQSAYILLMIALLNRAAESDRPGKAVLGDHRSQNLGRELRALIL